MLTLRETVDGWTNTVELIATCYDCGNDATHYAPEGYPEDGPRDENVLCEPCAKTWEAAGNGRIEVLDLS